MAAVAKRFVLGMFATAPRNGSGFLDFRFDRGEVRAFVGAVAKRLRFRLPASTPEVSARFNFLDERRFLSNDWFTHNSGTLFHPGQNARNQPAGNYAFTYWQ
jgi:hypothetical protein